MQNGTSFLDTLNSKVFAAVSVLLGSGAASRGISFPAVSRGHSEKNKLFRNLG